MSTRQILDLMRDTQAEYHREAGDLPKLLEQLDVVSRQHATCAWRSVRHCGAGPGTRSRMTPR